MAKKLRGKEKERHRQRRKKIKIDKKKQVKINLISKHLWFLCKSIFCASFNIFFLILSLVKPHSLWMLKYFKCFSPQLLWSFVFFFIKLLFEFIIYWSERPSGGKAWTYRYNLKPTFLCQVLIQVWISLSTSSFYDNHLI